MSRQVKRYHKIWNDNNPEDLIKTDKGEIIHHKNEDYEDDRIENLEKITRGEHNRIHKNRKYYTGPDHPFYGKHHTEETKKKISEAVGGENHPFWNKSLPEETKMKISEKLKGENHPLYGKHHTEESNQKNRLAHLGKKHTKEARMKMSLRKQKEDNPFYGKRHSDKNKKVIGLNTKKYIQEKGHPKGMLGKTHSDKYKERLSFENAGAKNPMAKRIMYKGKIYNCIKDAMVETGISRHIITKAAKFL